MRWSEQQPIGIPVGNPLDRHIWRVPNRVWAFFWKHLQFADVGDELARHRIVVLTALHPVEHLWRDPDREYVVYAGDVGNLVRRDQFRFAKSPGVRSVRRLLRFSASDIVALTDLAKHLN